MKVRELIHQLTDERIDQDAEVLIFGWSRDGEWEKHTVKAIANYPSDTVREGVELGTEQVQGWTGA